MDILYLFEFLASGFMLVMVVKEFDFKVSFNYALIYFMITVCDLGYYFLPHVRSLDAALIANTITYIGGSFLPYLMLRGVCNLCHVKQRFFLEILELSACIICFWVGATSGINQLNYMSVWLDTSGKYARLMHTYGPFHILFFISLLGFVAGTYGVILWSYKKKEEVSYKTTIELAAICSFDLLAYVFEMLLRSPVKLMPLAYFATECGLFVIIYQIQKYDISAVVSDYYRQSKDYGFVLIDSRMHFMGCNDVAEKWESSLSGLHIDRTFKGESPFIQNVRKIIESGKQGEFYLSYENQIIKHSVRFFYNKKLTTRLGYYVEMVDDTEKQNHLRLVENYMEQLKSEKERADEANAAKSQFLSTMSHEIRTPMNAIVGMTDILLREELPENVKEYLNNIKNSGDVLLTIINDILDFSKIESGKLEIIEDSYEPMSMFHDLSMIFLNRIGNKPVELLYDIDPEMPKGLYGDEKRLKQVIMNLTNNAIKFTEKGFVRLKVKAELEGEDSVHLKFEVQDSGQGIKKEDLDKLFVSFQQVDTKKNRNKEGTGLGLAISKQLVELMHGSIGVTSVYGEGSTFYFELSQKITDAAPAAYIKDTQKEACIALCMKEGLMKEQVKKLASYYQIPCTDLKEGEETEADFLITDNLLALQMEEKRHLRGNGGTLCALQNPMIDNISEQNVTVINKPLYSLNFCQMINHEAQVYRDNEEENINFTAPDARILVVDDNEMNLKVAKGLMAPLAMQIDMAEDGAQAVRMVQEKHYDLVFMDHMMPVMDGMEATAAIRELDGDYYAKLPIIALSANATSEAQEMFVQGKMNGFIAKPIQIKELVRCILTWLPDELIIPADPGDTPQEKNETEEPVPEIEGLDVAEGLKNCGSKELFMEMLGDFYRLIEPNCAKLEEFLEEDRIRDYTIEVHALKNTARMIGAMELSGKFYQMEQLGNAENKEEILKGFPELIALYKSYEPILAPFGKKEEKKQEVPVEKMCETLRKLHDATDSFDLDGADSAMKELDGYEFPEELQPMVEKLDTFVREVAMEEVMQLTEELLNKLKG